MRNRNSQLPHGDCHGHEIGIRNIAFQVNDIDAVVENLAADGYRLVGAIGTYEQAWRMAYVRGPEGIIVSVAEDIS